MTSAAEIVTQGAAAAGFAKILVDLVKLSPLPSMTAMLPVLAFLFSEGCAFLLAATGDVTFNRQTIAVTVLVGIGAAAGAIGLTAAQTQADKVNERIDKAIQMPAGTTRAQVDAAVEKQNQ